MKKILSIILTITVFLLFTQTTFASDKVTPYPPEVMQTPPIDEVKKEEKGGRTWLWVLLGIAVAGGVVAAAGGGGSSSSSSSSTGGGSVVVNY